jgi:N-acetyl-anhydromuramyl-L-alanine amidase AmpD
VTLKLEFDWAKGQDHGSRHNAAVDTLVIHTTEGGSIESATDWWDEEDVIASAHYVIDGKRIVQVVAEGDCAFHAGNRAMNRRSIGIEVVGKCDRRSTWTPEIMAQLVALSAEIVARHQIPIVHQPGPGICGHLDVLDPRNPNLRGGLGGHHDPGPYFPWQPYLDAIRAELHPVAEKEIA